MADRAGGYTKKGKEQRKKRMDEALTWLKKKKKKAKGLGLSKNLYR